MAKTKTDCDYEGKAKLITARAKGNAALIAAFSGLLLAGGNFVNDFLDRQHQRSLDESTYNAALAEIRSLKSLVASYHPPAPPAAAAGAPAMGELMMDLVAESDDIEEDDVIPQPAPEPDLVHAPSFSEIKAYVQRSGKPMRF